MEQGSSPSISKGFPKPIIYHLFAQIGAGKSWKIRNQDPSILRVIEKDLSIPSIQPDQIHWELQNSRNWALLPLFYSDPSRYGYLFQFEIMTSYVKQVCVSLLEQPEKRIFVLESGPFEAYFIYMKRLFDFGCMSTFEYESFRPIMDWWRKYFDHKVIYLQVPDAVCLQHIQQRKTPVEVDAINFTLLRSLSNYRHNYLDVQCLYSMYSIASYCTCQFCSDTKQE